MSLGVMDDHFLSERYSVDFLKEALTPRQDWHPFPTIEDREAWERLPESLRHDNVAAAEGWLAQPWPNLPERCICSMPVLVTGRILKIRISTAERC